MVETWLPIAGYEGLYEVSDLGRVRSLDRTVYSGRGNSRLAKGQVLKARPDKDGYQLVSLWTKGCKQDPKVHRLVADAFIPNPANLPEVDHENGERDHNQKTNLRWTTRSVNLRNRTQAIGASGIVGVRFRPGAKNPWQALGHSRAGKQVSLGCYPNAEGAKAARAKFVKEHYHG